MGFPHLLLLVVIALYTGAFFAYWFDFRSAGNRRGFWPARLVEAGFLFHTLFILMRVFGAQQIGEQTYALPLNHIGEQLDFLAWCLVFVYLLVVRQLKSDSFGLVLVPILVLLLVPGFFPFEVKAKPVPPGGMNAFFLLHVVSAFISYSSFALSFVASILYMVQHRALKRRFASHVYQKFPALEDLERLVFGAISWGIVLLTVAVVSGFYWSLEAIGKINILEPKSLASVVTLVVYAAIAGVYFGWHMKGRRMMLISAWAFVFVLFTFLGSGFFYDRFHVTMM